MLASPAVGELTGKVVVVTGASSGIGRALCLELAAERPRLVLAARDEQALAEVAGACREQGAEVLVVPTDVTDPAACRALVERTVAAWNALDVLVHNAGITMWSLFEEVTDFEIFAQLMRVNYLGPVHLTRHALPHLRRARGRLVAVASVAGLTGVPTRTGYAATKHAVFGFFDSLRIELQGSGVSVTLIAPDFVVSDIHRRALGPDGRALGTSPLREADLMTAEECARLMVPAIARRRRLLITSRRGRLGRWARLVWPGLIDRIAARAIARGQ